MVIFIINLIILYIIIEQNMSENVNRRNLPPVNIGRNPLPVPSLEVPTSWQQHQKVYQEPQQQHQSQKQASQERFYQNPQVQEQFVEKKSNLVHHNEILQLNERVLEKEEAAFKKEGEINLYRNEIQSLRDECGKVKSKLHAVELYASELQRKNDLLTQEISERNALIQELQSADIGLKIQLNMVH